MFDLTEKFIKEAFPETPIICARAAVFPTHSVEHLEELLAGNSWSDVRKSTYVRCSDGLNLLTLDGIYYYFPGFLCASLGDEESSGSLHGHIVYLLGSPKRSIESIDRATKLISMFTFDQKVAFLLWLGCYSLRFGICRDAYFCYLAFEDMANTKSFPGFRKSLCDSCDKELYWGI